MSKEINGTSAYSSIVILSPQLIWCDLSLCLSCLFSPTHGYLQIYFTTGCQSVLSHIFVIAFVFVCNCQIKENSLHLSLEDFKILLFYYTYSIIFLLFGVILWYSALHLSVPHIPHIPTFLLCVTFQYRQRPQEQTHLFCALFTLSQAPPIYDMIILTGTTFQTAKCKWMWHCSIPIPLTQS